VVLETRAFDDAQQTLARQPLVRYLDYEIDYEHGLLLFKQPVPATDPSGNPLFIMVTYGAEAGGAESTVWGLRASADARALVGRDALDSLRIGSTFIRDGRPGAERDLAGIDVGALRLGRLAFTASHRTRWRFRGSQPNFLADIHPCFPARCVQRRVAHSGFARATRTRACFYTRGLALL
jgi:hypothetical protein